MRQETMERRLEIESLEERIAPGVLGGGHPAQSANPENTANPEGSANPERSANPEGPNRAGR